MSSSGDEGLDRDEKSHLSPSALLDAPSSQVGAADEKPSASQYSEIDENVTAETHGERQDYDTGEIRENRFTGNEATWRQYTADGRGLIASLDQQRADDLSIHLYNAHALKQRLYDPRLAREAQPWQSKSLWMQKDAKGKTPWHPDQSWTAWPLTVADVPRKEEHFGQEYPDDQGGGRSFRKLEPWRPSGDLQEEVQALMLRKAKEQFRRRSWTSAADHARGRSMQGRQRSRSKSVPRSRSVSRRGSDAGIVSASLEESPPESYGLPAGTRAPECLADEDKARQLLTQSTRHVLCNLDKLLMGLQRSRRGHSKHNPSHVQSASHSQSARTIRRKRKAEAIKAEAIETDDATAGAAASPIDRSEEDHESRPPSRAEHTSGEHLLGTRDWSEVLGVAALTGWDSTVLDRATKRCTALFGESMTMRSMPETAAEKTADRVVTYTPEVVPDITVSDDSGESDSEEIAFACPESTCPRASQPFALRWRLREHLKKTHGYTQEDLDDSDDSSLASKSAVDEQEHQTVLQAQSGNKIVSHGAGSGAVRTDGFLRTVDVIIPKRRIRQGSLSSRRKHEATEGLNVQEPMLKKQKPEQPSEARS